MPAFPLYINQQAIQRNMIQRKLKTMTMRRDQKNQIQNMLSLSMCDTYRKDGSNFETFRTSEMIHSSMDKQEKAKQWKPLIPSQITPGFDDKTCQTLPGVQQFQNWRNPANLHNLRKSKAISQLRQNSPSVIASLDYNLGIEGILQINQGTINVNPIQYFAKRKLTANKRLVQRSLINPLELKEKDNTKYARLASTLLQRKGITNLRL